MQQVFVTGVTGYIGGAIAARLIQAGYAVSGLVRQEKDFPAIQAAGITPVGGSLDDEQVITRQVQAADAVIHAADADNAFTVATILEALAGTGKKFIHTSGSSITGDKARGEYAGLEPLTFIPEKPRLEKAARVAIDRAVLAAADVQVHSIVVCPTMIYGTGTGIKKDSIQIPLLTAAAREAGIGVHVGKGENRWSNVHIADLADLYLLALEKAPAGSFFYAENGLLPLQEIAAAISRALGFKGATKGLSMEEAIRLWTPEGAHFGLGSNSIVSASPARELGWAPQYDTLLAGIAG
ncbi:NAD-dependent epimerase/dehydratase family protein [Chitinophaga nivalis]|uniref:NAD-dependent epimerase/dehydratase family protein n=1 Tax=Chitinophaga nivalis TaxID=2991709 RepID=A0ABT3IPH3_9BACT|nr:NAD-dependent epimerase/dehydratase family protein [Chitinophaga nivalis]MCW3464437.1 NAD-dependent epimerase/dehydratase family protein [Chitinophaga nivalis]MCW3485872.1 NAD-dependent epimerase/dehydratase family protein [Chitinophaga nivalis]